MIFDIYHFILSVYLQLFKYEQIYEEHTTDFFIKTVRSGLNNVGNYHKTSYNNNCLFLYENVYSFFGSKLNIFDVARNFSEPFLQE